jgi:hypothetical protein
LFREGRFLRRVYLAWFFVHFLLIVTVCTRDTFSLIADGFTFLPDSFKKDGDKGEKVARLILGEGLPIHQPLRQAETIYQHAAGIELGYGFFAPGVPNSFKLLFEIHYPDGRVEYDLPHVRQGAGGSRLIRFLEEIGRLEYEPLREMILKMLAYSAWREHPGATNIRAVFGFIQLPTPTEARRGKSEIYRFMYAYDFVFDQATDHQQNK